MRRREFLSRLAGWGLQSGIACSAIGCGTLFHSERCGRPHGGRIDWKVAALDGLGLILFFIPGVIAFVVDFSTGAIYLPEPEYGFPEYGPPPQEAGPALSNQPPVAVPAMQGPSHSVLAPTAGQQSRARLSGGSVGDRPQQRADLNRVVVVGEELGPQRIEQVVANHVGRPVSLTESDARISRLPRLDRFANQCLQHQRSREFGFPLKTLFDGLQRA
jgi:hypothetical protein